MTKGHGGRNRTIERLEEQVDALYAFRDGYFETHPVGEFQNKWRDVEAELEKVRNAFVQNKKLEPRERAKYFYLLGRALNVLQTYKPEAEEVLTKAIKLDVKLYKAWNELGETYFKKNDLNEAKNCFLGALEQQNNKESLRNLSILMRTKTFWNLVDGMKYAKEAVELDPKDGKSWLILGNAYTSFYGVRQSPEILSLCRSAYVIAEKDERLARDPCLYYNRGIVERFQDDYESAVLSFERAEALDPTWMEPRLEKAKLMEYLDKAQSFVHEKGRLRGKKLKKLAKTLNPGVHLGKNRNKKLVHLQDLKKGVNKGKVVLGIVAATFPEESTFNLTLVDVHETAVVVNIYSLPEDRGILVGSVVAIPDPAVTKVQITGNGRNYSFYAIRVENPSTITVNGKPVRAAKNNILFTTTTVAD